MDTLIGKDIPTQEAFAYIEDDMVITPKLKANIGLHYSTLLNKYHSLQPRISARYLVGPGFSVKASYVNMVQYINLLTNTTIGLPTDLWVPATDKVKPQKSDQVSAATSFRLTRNFSLNLETYYKWMYNIIEYQEGASYFDQRTEWEDKITAGKGWSYGFETLLEKMKANPGMDWLYPCLDEQDKSKMSILETSSLTVMTDGMISVLLLLIISLIN
ncbi:MAG: TonB-dependent receptor [Bacteroidales bacterium]|nr:TonB-dependent receptor [Bacteroidales bacterium]